MGFVAGKGYSDYPGWRHHKCAGRAAKRRESSWCSITAISLAGEKAWLYRVDGSIKRGHLLSIRLYRRDTGVFGQKRRDNAGVLERGGRRNSQIQDRQASREGSFDEIHQDQRRNGA